MLQRMLVQNWLLRFHLHWNHHRSNSRSWQVLVSWQIM
jgi:hypothetical protein